jgi:hypothetical protein
MVSKKEDSCGRSGEKRDRDVCEVVSRVVMELVRELVL